MVSLTKAYVREVFALLEQGKLDQFLDQYVHEQVQWEITGSSVLAGRYHSRQDFIDRAINPLKASLDGGINMRIPHIYVDGDTAIVEMEAMATAKAGHPYNNRYVWIHDFQDGRIITARVYYDGVLVNKTIC